MQKNSNQPLRILLKSSFVLLLLLAACASPVEKAISDVEKIDESYGASIDDHRLGLKYFDVFVRELPMNDAELSAIIVQLEELEAETTDAEAKDYVTFRKKLYQAEQLYKTGSRKPLAQYDSVIRCSQGERILVSVAEVEESVELHKEAVNIHVEYEWELLPSRWAVRMGETQDIILERATLQRGIIEENCLPLQEQSEN